jgi:hypothetical protein
MIVIKWFNSIAERPDGGPWHSDDKAFADALNVIATPEQLRGYYPDPEDGLIELVKEQYKGVEVLEKSKNNNNKYSETTVF